MTEEQAAEKSESETQSVLKVFMESLDVDEEVAGILVAEGFSNVEEVAYVPESELLEIDEFDEEIVAELRGRARDYLLTTAIASEEKLSDVQPAEDLLAMEGMDDTLAHALAGMGVATMDDLAEQSIDELMVIDDMDEEKAGQLIMTARKPWFENDEAE